MENDRTRADSEDQLYRKTLFVACVSFCFPNYTRIHYKHQFKNIQKLHCASYTREK